MAVDHVNGNGTEEPAEPMDTAAAPPAAPAARSEHFQTLLDAGLPQPVAEKLDEVYVAGLVAHSDLDERAIEALKEFNEEGALQVLVQFKESDLSHVQNKSAFLCGVMKTYRQREKQGTKVADATKGPDEAKLKTLLERTGYTLDVTTGQRKYGGPPPESVHEGGQPSIGTEIFVGKIPRDLFEDELVPLFEKAGPIWDLRLMMDPLSGMNRGYAFVTFCTKDAAQEAVQLCNNYEIRPGKHIGVCISVANNRLFVGSIPKSKTKEQIVEEFSKVTEGLSDVILYHQPDDKKKNRGFCFLEYEDHKTAAQARRRLMSGKVKVWGNVVTVEWADPIEDPDPEVMAKVKVLFVRNLSNGVTEELLESSFGRFGKLERVKKLKDYAFIHFEERDGAVKALEEMNGKDLEGEHIEIVFAKPPDQKRKDRKAQRQQAKTQMYDDYYYYGPPMPPPSRGRGRGVSRGGGYPYPDYYGYDDYYDYYGYDYSSYRGGGYDDPYYGYDDFQAPSGRGRGGGRGSRGGPVARGRGGAGAPRGRGGFSQRGGGGGGGGGPGRGTRGARGGVQPRGRGGVRGGARGGRGGNVGGKRKADGYSQPESKRHQTHNHNWGSQPIAQQPLQGGDHAGKRAPLLRAGRLPVKSGLGAGRTLPLDRMVWRLKRWLKVDVLREAGRQYPLVCCLLAAMLLLTVLLNRYLHVLLLFWSFLAGVITFYWSLGPGSLLPNVLFRTRTRDQRLQQQELFPLGSSCAVCGKVKCKRHRPTLLLENYQPWLDLKVHSKVDASIAEVFELVLENFVYPWYRDITDDEACVDELRMTFRFFASVVVRRALKVDVPVVLADKVMKAVLKHMDVLARVRQRVGVGEGLQQAALEEYGADLHTALRSRREELLYLRSLTEILFSHLLPPKATDCRSLALLLREVVSGAVLLPTMDFMADPDTVNLMVLIFVDDSPPDAPTEPPSAMVPFLQRYAEVRNKKASVLKLELKEIREQQDLLFRFMNFLKQEGAVHVLQFCLTVEEFNDKILSPELSDGQLQALHGEVQHIYQTYCLDESVDKISFHRLIVDEIRNIAEGPYCGVARLQTMPCLFEAYEHVLSLLEHVFTPMFCHSDEYFRYLLKGAESPTRNSKMSRNASKRGEAFGIGRIGSRIRGVFKSTTMEGSMLPETASTDPDEAVEEATVVVEDDGPVEVVSVSSQRDLAAWRVSIPYIDLHDDEAKRERVPVFCIDVERNDRKEVGHQPEKWSVLRRYLEFYVLESKLTEFHGSFADAQLPSKRIIGPKNYEFLVSKKDEFEEYLQRLVKHPELSNSQLLANFLSPYNMETQFPERMLPDVNLGKIFKSVPGKLVKERGQNLDPFLQSFFSSCESPKPKPSRPELTVLSPSAENSKKLFSHMFRNNANLTDSVDRRQNQNCFMEMVNVSGLYDYMMHVGRKVFLMPDWLHHMLSAGRILFKKTVEAYMEQYMQTKVDQVLQEHRLVSLITQLRDAVFCEGSEERSLEDKQERAKQTFEEMMKYLPDVVEKCIGEENKYEGIRLLFDGLQQPLLNKQMSYVLLDIAVQELFPELAS
ncbi:unnamed protein product [Merluccius merluccius]